MLTGREGNGNGNGNELWTETETNRERTKQNQTCIQNRIPNPIRDRDGKVEAEKETGTKTETEKKTAILLQATMGGWQRLETSFKVLQRLLEGRAESPEAPQDPETPLVNARMRSAVRRALTHKNRFVRETGFYTLRALFSESLGGVSEE